jgi:hypothetical protein
MADAARAWRVGFVALSIPANPGSAGALNRTRACDLTARTVLMAYYCRRSCTCVQRRKGKFSAHLVHVERLVSPLVTSFPVEVFRLRMPSSPAAPS